MRQLCTSRDMESKINFGDLTPYLTYATPHINKHINKKLLYCGAFYMKYTLPLEKNYIGILYSTYSVLIYDIDTNVDMKI
jgi:hypothetical protein